MDKQTDKPEDAEELRRRAEQRLADQQGTATDKSIDEKRLVHELQVYQIELEMQNEALREARTNAETALEHYSDLFDFSPIAYFTLSSDGVIKQTNFCGEKLLGIARYKLAGQPFVTSVSSEYRPVFIRFLENVFASDNTQYCEITLQSGENNHWVAIEAIADKTRKTCLAAVLDITEKKRSEEIIRKEANIDPLTGLPNRRLFLDRLQRDIKKAHRADRKLALMFLDLDHFKEINDTLGHDMGDRLLTETTQRLSVCIRETDTLARPGGDEFTIILGELDELGIIDRVAQSIMQCMTAPFLLKGERCYVSVSIGIALYPDDADNMNELLKKADQAMYAAKNQGRNRFCYFAPAMQEDAENRLRLTNDIRHALIYEEFWVAYQPIVDLATGTIQKAEALLRWQHPRRGLIGPSEFIPIAEATGMIIEISEWVFRQTVNQVAIWRRNHCPEFQISINKSPAQFHNHSYRLRDWFDYLQLLGLPGSSIMVEITERLLMDASSIVSEKLLAFRDAGVQVSLDDFGTGYSSLSFLKKFDIDYLKIDRSFVSNLIAESTDMTLCEAMILMAHKLGLKVIAEGIETPQQRDLLMRAGCDYGQGYLFSKPVSAEEFEKLFNPGYSGR